MAALLVWVVAAYYIHLSHASVGRGTQGRRRTRQTFDMHSDASHNVFCLRMCFVICLFMCMFVSYVLFVHTSQLSLFVVHCKQSSDYQFVYHSGSADLSLLSRPALPVRMWSLWCACQPQTNSGCLSTEWDEFQMVPSYDITITPQRAFVSWVC